MLANAVMDLLKNGNIKGELSAFVDKVEKIWTYKNNPYGHENLYQTYLSCECIDKFKGDNQRVLIAQNVGPIVQESSLYGESQEAFITSVSNEGVPSYFQPDLLLLEKDRIIGILQLKTTVNIDFSWGDTQVANLIKIKTGFPDIECSILFVTRDKRDAEKMIADLKTKSKLYMAKLLKDGKLGVEVQNIKDLYQAVMFKVL